MRYNLKIFYIVLLLVYFLNIQANATENSNFNQFGDFASRSTIMRTLNGENRITQKQKDILQEKKLTPTVNCLIGQIKNNNIENVKILLDSKVNPNEEYNFMYPIHVAAKTNNMEMVEILYSYGAKLDRGFYSELYEAIKNKNTQMAKFFMDKNAQLNYKDAVTGNTPIYLAIKNDMIDIAKELIAKGANIDKKTYALIQKKKLNSLIEKLN